MTTNSHVHLFLCEVPHTLLEEDPLVLLSQSLKIPAKRKEKLCTPERFLSAK